MTVVFIGRAFVSRSTSGAITNFAQELGEAVGDLVIVLYLYLATVWAVSLEVKERSSTGSMHTSRQATNVGRRR